MINPQLEEFGSLDWRRNDELALAGYAEAEAMRDKLLPLAVSEEAWAAYQAAKHGRRRSELATPQFLSISGAVPADQRRMEEILGRYVNQPFDATLLENDLAAIAGLDRYESVGWQLVQENGQPGLRIHARPKTHAPPFLMLGVSLQNTTSDEFAFQLAARFLAFDVLGSGSELRLDGAVGVQPRIGAELYRPIGRSPLFVAATALANDTTLNFISDDTIVAKYGEVRAGGGLGVGVNLGRYDEVRLTFMGGELEASVEAGNPGLPDISGTETRGQLRWLHDGQDSPVVPSGGVRSEATVDYIFDSPEVPDVVELNRTNDDLIQTEFSIVGFLVARPSPIVCSSWLARVHRSSVIRCRPNSLSWAGLSSLARTTWAHCEAIITAC